MASNNLLKADFMTFFSRMFLFDGACPNGAGRCRFADYTPMRPAATLFVIFAAGSGADLANAPGLVAH
jgi:hypothetical protein